MAAEAMLNGIPVVGSDIPPIRDLLGDGEAGLLFAVGDTGRRWRRSSDWSPTGAAEAARRERAPAAPPGTTLRRSASAAGNVRDPRRRPPRCHLGRGRRTMPCRRPGRRAPPRLACHLVFPHAAAARALTGGRATARS